MYAFERRVKEPHIGWFAVNPGTVYTGIARNNSAAMRYSFKALEVVRKYQQFKNDYVTCDAVTEIKRVFNILQQPFIWRSHHG